MAQRRMVDKRISVSEQVSCLSVEAKLLFTWSIPHTDDLGLLPYSGKVLKAMIFPMIEIRQDSFDKLVKEISEAKDINGNGLFTEFEYEGEKFWRMPNFGKHQTLKKDRKPSTFLKSIKTWDDVVKLGFQLEDSGFQMDAEGKRSKGKRSEEKRIAAKAVFKYFLSQYYSIKEVEYLPSWKVDYGIIYRFIEIKHMPDYKDLIDWFLNSQKSREYPSISACFSTATINAYKIKHKDE